LPEIALNLKTIHLKTIVYTKILSKAAFNGLKITASPGEAANPATGLGRSQKPIQGV